MADYKFKNPKADLFIKSLFEDLPHKTGREYKTLELLDKDHSLSEDQVKVIMGMLFFEKGMPMDELMGRVSDVLLAGDNLDFEGIDASKSAAKRIEVWGIFALLSDWEGVQQ